MFVTPDVKACEWMDNTHKKEVLPKLTVHWPPVRYFIGCILMAAVSVLIEQDSHISSGGVSGLSIGIADSLHISMGLVSTVIKLAIFGLVFIFAGKTTAFWTVVAAVFTGICMWLFELLPIDFDWPKWTAFGVILLFSKLPIGLLVSRGLSTGGFTAIGQLLQSRVRMPLWSSLLFLNLLSVFAMLAAHGLVSGTLTAVIAVSSGIATETWAFLARRVLDRKACL